MIHHCEARLRSALQVFRLKIEGYPIKGREQSNGIVLNSYSSRIKGQSILFFFSISYVAYCKLISYYELFNWLGL